MKKPWLSQGWGRIGRALKPLVSTIVLLCPSLSCTTAPSTSSSGSTMSAASSEIQAKPVGSPAPLGPAVPPTVPAGGAWSDAFSPADSALSSRVTIEWTSLKPDLIMRFPISISERGDRIAAIVSVDSNREAFDLEWLIIKSVSTDKIEQIIDLLDAELSAKIDGQCVHGPGTCIHMPEVEQRVQAANALLARHQWRPFPCYRDLGPIGPNRFGPGCEQFRELKMSYQDPWLLISHQGRVLLNQRRPTWAYRGASCRQYMHTDPESMAFDPETGIFVVGLYFYATSEGCDVPLWDVHPIRVPMLGRKGLSDRDGGAP